MFETPERTSLQQTKIGQNNDTDGGFLRTQECRRYTYLSIVGASRGGQGVYRVEQSQFQRVSGIAGTDVGVRSVRSNAMRGLQPTRVKHKLRTSLN